MKYSKVLPALLLSIGLSAGAVQAMEAPSQSEPLSPSLFELSEVSGTQVAEKDKGRMCASHLFGRNKKKKGDKEGEDKCGSSKCGSDKDKDEKHSDDKCGSGTCGSDK